MSTQVLELAEKIKDKGRRSTEALPPLLEQAEQLARDSSLEPVSRALAHRAAANARQLMNDFGTALHSYNEAIAILESLDEPEELGRTLHAKVGLLNFMCRFDELLVCADRARSLFESLNDRHRLARLDANLSHAYHRLNRFDRVLQFAERALPALEEAGDHEGYIVALTNSAVALMLLNHFEEAERRYTRALELALARGWTVWALSCRYNIAFLLYLRGNSAAALRDIGELRLKYQEVGDRRQVCQCWLNESEILLEIGDVEGARDAAREAEQTARFLELSLETGKALLFQAASERRMNAAGDVIPLLDEATQCFKQERNDVWVALAKLQLAVLRGKGDETEALREAMAARSLLEDAGLPNRLALADIVVGRIRKAQGEIERSLESFRSALRLANEGRSEWMQFHAAHELGALLATSEPAQGEQHLRSAEKMLDSLWDQLGSDDLKLAFLSDRENVYSPLVKLTVDRSPESAFELSEKARSRVLRESLGAASLETSSLPACLSADESVVEYFVMREDIIVFMLTSDGVSHLRLPFAADHVQAAICNLERHFASCSVSWERLSAARRHQKRTAEAHLRELHRVLLEPIASQLRRRVVIVPHGVLHRVPFHALWDGNNFLMDSHEVAYTPSASLYCSPAPALESNSAVFIAFAGASKTTAEDEVREAAGKVPGAAIAINPSVPELTELFSKRHALIHIAGHAGIDTVGGRLSWIETAGGRLTQRDLTDLSMRADTVVITGCKTARRAIQPGDEWQGLMRSFYLAGAGTVISALWDIRDESARRFASEFYDSLPAGNLMGAVQSAITAVRNWEEHPYFWAAFSAFIRKR